MMWNLLLGAVGIALLYFGGDVLVASASRVGRAYGLSPLVIGLTIVAFGTSAPELATSLVAVFADAPAIAMGNVLGSNVANLALILGLAALLCPIPVERGFLRRDPLVMLGASALVLPFATNGRIGRVEGLLLVALLLVYLTALFRAREVPEELAVDGGPAMSMARAWIGIVGGLLLLVGGAEFLVRGGAALARDFGVSERVIGLTLVAVGTSLPELAASVAAAARRESSIVLGNVVGSNIFNVLAILGVTSLVRPIVVSWSEIRVDVWVMLGVSVAAVIIMRTRLRLSRLEGLALLTMYAAYMSWLTLG